MTETLAAKRGQMENAVKNLEAMFQKADSGIDNLTQRLNHEFENNEEVRTNPAELVQRLNEFKKEYATLVQEAAEIQEATQDAVQEFQGHLNDVFQVLTTLQTPGGLQGKEKPEELVRLEQMLSIQSLPWGQATAHDVTGGATSSEQCSGASIPDLIKETPRNTESHSPPEMPAESPATLRQNTDEFVEITEDEFNSVSELIRGRVKLVDVNSVYRILWNYFKTEKRKRDLLAPEDMQKMGMKVAGQTGQAKLKVLRALKLLRMTTKGEVALL